MSQIAGNGHLGTQISNISGAAYPQTPLRRSLCPPPPSQSPAPARNITYSAILQPWHLSKSYLSGRSQCIVVNGKLSQKFPLNCGVPQGSCLGPLLFNIYVSSLFEIIHRHFPDAHLFADDLQLYLSFSPSSSVDEDNAILAMHNCVDDIKNWATSNGLTLNEDSALLAMQNCAADIKNWATSNVSYVKRRQDWVCSYWHSTTAMQDQRLWT